MFPIFITLHSLSLFKLPEGMNFILWKYNFWRIYNLLVANFFNFCLKISLFCPHSWKILLLDKEFYSTAIIIQHIEDTIPFLQTSLVAAENSALNQSLLYRQTFFSLSSLWCSQFHYYMSGYELLFMYLTWELSSFLKPWILPFINAELSAIISSNIAFRIPFLNSLWNSE